MKTIELSCVSSAYKIKVIVHDTHAKFRRAVRESGNKERDVIACCVQWEFPNQENYTSELHFSVENFTPELVAHECVHAASYQARLRGLVPWSDEHEEYIATTVQQLTKAILDKLA